MEVHHHSHIPTSREKKWTHYFWEFFMLFLAVTLGFFVENQREHYVEHRREKQYMQSMVEDLIKDIQLLQKESAATIQQFNGLDSLVQIISRSKLEEEEIRKMYILQKRFLYPLTLELVNRTEVQLKNAGAMRLIRNQVVNDSIVNYWYLKDRIIYTREAINGHRIKAKDLSFLLFDNKYYTKSQDGFNLNASEKKIALLPHSAALLMEFGNRVAHIRELLQFNYNRRLDIIRDSAQRLIELIKKEYHLQ
ncbi:MAG TPA: hypothetical protein VFH07_08160 [Chitinophagaceae bacterium]|nr:hypothetical protein [Chitinophagaceae bacterium]